MTSAPTAPDRPPPGDRIDAPSALARWWASAAGIDPRSLALFRLGIAAVLLCDLVSRAGDLRAHYTDWGILPRWAVVTWLGRGAWLSPYLWRDGALWAAALMVLTAGAAVGLLLGWRSRLMAATCFVLVSSLHARNPAIVYGGDNVLRVLLFWMPLLPLPGAWAIGRREAGPYTILRSPAVFAIRLQLCLVYWVTAVFKLNAVWLRERDAILTALAFDQMATSWGKVLRRFPSLLRALAPATVGLELAGPLLVWSPWLTGPLRAAVVLAFVTFHLAGLAPALVLGIFPWVCAVAWALFLPGWVWQRVGTRAEVAAGPRVRTARAAVALLAVLLVYVTVDAAGRIWPERVPLSRSFQLPARVLGVRQDWDMFVRPPHDDGWLVAAGRLADGSLRDLRRDEPLDLRKPASVAHSYGNARWIKYLSQLNDRAYVYHRRLFASHLCRRWDEEHAGDRRAVAVRLYFFLEKTLAQGEEAPPRPLVLWQQRCPR